MTRNAKYYTGMRVLATFPYIAPQDPMNCEYVAHVVRVESLANNKFGVAVELLSTMEGENIGREQT